MNSNLINFSSISQSSQISKTDIEKITDIISSMIVLREENAYLKGRLDVLEKVVLKEER